MGFKKGKDKTGGRERGVKNKKTEQWEAFAEHCLSGGLEKFQQELAGLKGEKYVNAYLSLLEYHKPKLSRTTLEGDSDKPLGPTVIINKIVSKDVRNRPTDNSGTE